MASESLKHVLTAAIQRGASDIHFAVGYTPYFRIKGDLLPAKHPEISSTDTLAIARTLLDEPEWDPQNLRRERDVSFSVAGVGRFRAHIFKQRGSISVVIRAIPYDVKGLDSLNLPATIRDIVGAQRGLVLVSGTVGTGRSTTIAGMIKHINETRFAHIVTIEDPIEFLFPQSKSVITQREIGQDTPSFRDAMIATLRQDPDIIMVGEVTDEETAEGCLKAAETGHLVISAINAKDVTTALQRFVSVFSPEKQPIAKIRLADSLTAAISQRLLPNKSGLGQLPAVEILRATRSARDVIRQGAARQDLERIMTEGKETHGMQTFDQHIAIMSQTGQLKPDLAKSATNLSAMQDDTN